MAIYVTSDLHGLPLEKLAELLRSVHFSDRDWLYLLGDVIDRENDGGVPYGCAPVLLRLDDLTEHSL